MLVAHVSDTHLGYRQFQLEERERDFYNAFEQVVDRVLEERARVLLHTGDFFDTSRPQPRALIEAYRQLRRLRESGVRVIAIPGDHDLPRRRGVTPLALFSEQGLVTLVHSREARVGDVVFRGVLHHRAYQRERLVKQVLPGLKPPSGVKAVLMLHQGLEELFKIDAQLSLADLPRGYSYYAMGHYHRRSIMVLEDGAPVAYSGSTEVKDVRDAMDLAEEGKGFLLVDLSGDEASVEKVDLDIRPQLVVERLVDGYGGLETLLGELAGMLAGARALPVLHLRLRLRNLSRKVVAQRVRGLADKCLVMVERYVEEGAGVPGAPGGRVREEEAIAAALREAGGLLARLVGREGLVADFASALARGELGEAEKVLETLLRVAKGGSDDSQES